MNKQRITFMTSPQHIGERIMLSFIFQGIGLFIVLALISSMKHITSLNISTLQNLVDSKLLVKNDLGTLGLMLSNILIIDLFGISSFVIPLLFLITGAKLLLPNRVRFRKGIGTSLFLLLWTSFAVDYYFPNPTTITWYNITGHFIHRIGTVIRDLIGAGLILFLILSFIGFIFFVFVGLRRKNRTTEEAITNQVIPHRIIPPYKMNRAAAYYEKVPHAELTSAYFTAKRSFSNTHANPEKKGIFHAEAAHFTIQNSQHTAPIDTLQQNKYEYQQQGAPVYLQSDGAIDNNAKDSGYKTAHLIFDNHNRHK